MDKVEKLYNVHCTFKDGSKTKMDGMSINDLHNIVDTFENMMVGFTCSIEVIKA